MYDAGASLPNGGGAGQLHRTAPFPAWDFSPPRWSLRGPDRRHHAVHALHAMKLERALRGKHLDVWESFARDIGGAWHAPDSLEAPRIEVPHPRGPLRIEGNVTWIMTGKVMIPMLSTTFSALLPATRAQRFSVSRASFASAVADWFGALDIHVDDDTFDHAFVLKGETPDLVRELFASAPLRERYLRDFEGQLHRRDDSSLLGDPTPDADPFELSVPGYVDTPERMHALWTLFVETLERLPDGARPVA